jgi:beta-1,4-galactosyltransferase 1
MTEDQIKDELLNQGIQFGGKWEPKDCKARHHVAILVPFRDRQEHLHNFLLNMHPIFARQQLSYKIYLIEPIAKMRFNRGLLLNIGFTESNKDENHIWDCHAFHDVSITKVLSRNFCAAS